MLGIYTYIPETNHVPREYTVAAILSLLFMVLMSPVPALVLLYFYVSTSRSMCAVPNMAVFCSSLTSWLPGMLLTFIIIIIIIIIIKIEIRLIIAKLEVSWFLYSSLYSVWLIKLRRMRSRIKMICNGEKGNA
jgi:hypothetical protein